MFECTDENADHSSKDVDRTTNRSSNSSGLKPQFEQESDVVSSSNVAIKKTVLNLLPETETQVLLLAESPGNQLERVKESARADIRTVQAGRRSEAERTLEFAHRHRNAAGADLTESVARLKYTEPKITDKNQRAKVSAIGWFVVLLLVIVLVGVLWAENSAAAQSLLSTGAFDVDSMERARMVMLTPVAVGIAFIFGFKVLPFFVRRRAFLSACGVLTVAFLTWVVCFAIQTEKYHHEATQTLSLSEIDYSEGGAEEIDLADRGWSAWLMFGCLSLMTALTTFIGHTGVESYLSRYETWVTNPEFTCAKDDVQANEDEMRLSEREISTSERKLSAYLAQEEQAVAQACSRYLSLKKLARLSAFVLLVGSLFTGCTSNVETSQNRVSGKLNQWANQAQDHKIPVTRILAISPLLPPEEKQIVRKQLELEFHWITEKAPMGSMTVIVNGLDCTPVARLEAVSGVARIRKKAVAKVIPSIREFLAKHQPRTKDDGRLHLPRLAQTAKQWGLPEDSHIIVFGNPLFLNDGTDQFFSMADGRVPSDGCLFEDPKLNIYSIIGREKALAGQLWHLGWSDDSVFEDDTHRQAVLRFWHVYFQSQSARLVTAQRSFVAAADAARERATDPLFYGLPDAESSAAMVRIVKVQREEEISRNVEETDMREEQTEEKKESTGRESDSKSSQKAEITPIISLEKKEQIVKQTNSEKERDVFGNIEGTDQDLIVDGEMKGQRILMVTFHHDQDVNQSPLNEALVKKGFLVEQVEHPLPSLLTFEQMLDRTDQMWLWSSSEKGLLPKAYLKAITKRWQEGKLSICLLADNMPFTSEASDILHVICPGSEITGTYRGEQMLSAKSAAGISGFDENSALFHNIDVLFEGTTISMVTGPGLVPACYSSDGSILIATFRQGKSSRLVIHGGFTSFYKRFWDDAGVSRFAVNCAGWLGGADAKSKRSLQK